MTVKEALLFGEARLKESGIKDAAIDAWYLLEYVTGLSRASYYAGQDAAFLPEAFKRYEGLIEKRGRHIPLQHLTGEQEFMGLTFKVNANVLVPRQDTETLVEAALSLLGQCPETSGKIKILDIGTGSGCVILSILYHAAQRGIDAEGSGTDISEKALKTASMNAGDLGIKARFFNSDIFENVDGRYGMIVCNPPYIRTEELKTLTEEVRLHDPREALDGKSDGLYFYKKIIPKAGAYLEDNGFLLFETGYDKAESVKELIRQAGYSDIRIKKDLEGRDRVVAGRYRSGCRV